MKEHRSTIILITYILIMVSILVFSIITLKPAEPQFNDSVKDEDSQSIKIETQIVYIPVYSESENVESSGSTTTNLAEENIYVVKSYNGKIGIFKEDKLYEVIEVYTKTLPKTDRDQLEKGIVIDGEEDLRSIIEDYTG